MTRQIRLQGSCASSGEYPECLELIASGKVNVDRFISATAPLEEGPGWFDRLYKQRAGPDEGPAQAERLSQKERTSW